MSNLELLFSSTDILSNTLWLTFVCVVVGYFTDFVMIRLRFEEEITYYRTKKIVLISAMLIFITYLFADIESAKTVISQNDTFFKGSMLGDIVSSLHIKFSTVEVVNLYLVLFIIICMFVNTVLNTLIITYSFMALMILPFSLVKRDIKNVKIKALLFVFFIIVEVIILKLLLDLLIP